MSEINDQLNDLFDSMSEEEEIELSEETGIERPINEVSPPGWGHTKGPETGGSAKAFDDARKEGRFKGSKEDMFAIMWAGKNKGDKTHYKEKSNPPKKKENVKEDHIQATADRLGQFISSEDKKTRRTIDGLNSLTEEEKRDRKIQLLENEVTKLAQMTRAHFPGEGGRDLVSGIGQGGDGQTPGSGAVWLWDLDDVDIGTPLNGQYPTIPNGSLLVYNSVSDKWVAGASSGGGGVVTTASVQLTNPVTDNNVDVGDLPAPGTLTTQEGVNQWIAQSLLYIDDRISGGTDNDMEFDGDIEFIGNTTQSLVKYNGGDLDIKVSGTDKASAVIVGQFTTAGLTLPSKTLAAQAVNATTGTFGGAVTIHTLTTGSEAGVAINASAGQVTAQWMNIGKNPETDDTDADYDVSIRTSGKIITPDANVTTLSGARQGLVYKLVAGDGVAFDGQASTHIGGTVGNDYNTNVGTLKVNATVIRTTGTQTITGATTLRDQLVVAPKAAPFTTAYNSLQIQGYVNSSKSNLLLKSYIRPSASTLQDYIEYFGDTSGNNMIVTRSAVQTMIDAGGGSGINFKGTINLTTDNAPANPNGGDMYINDTAGTVKADADPAWTGIAGDACSAGQQVIYNSANSEWVLGVVEDDSSYVKVDGSNDMTGGLVIDIPSSDSSDEALVIENNNVPTITLNKDGSSSFAKQMTLSLGAIPETNQTGALGGSDHRFSTVYGGVGDFVQGIQIAGTSTIDSTGGNASIVPVTDGTGFLGSTTKHWDHFYVDGVTVRDTVVTNDLTLGKSSAYGDLDITGNITINGGQVNATTPADGVPVWKKLRPAQEGYRDFIIEGTTEDAPTDNTGQLFSVFRNDYSNTNEVDAINYKGRVDAGDNIQTKTSVISLISDNAPTITQGGVIQKGAGATNTSGNLAVRQTLGASTEGRIYIQQEYADSDGSTASQTNITLFPSGTIQMGNTLTLGSSNLNSNKVIRSVVKSTGKIAFQAGVDLESGSQSTFLNFTNNASPYARTTYVSGRFALGGGDNSFNINDSVLYIDGVANNSGGVAGDINFQALNEVRTLYIRGSNAAQPGRGFKLAMGTTGDASHVTFRPNESGSNSSGVNTASANYMGMQIRMFSHGEDAESGTPQIELDPTTDGGTVTAKKYAMLSGSDTIDTSSSGNHLQLNVNPSLYVNGTRLELMGTTSGAKSIYSYGESSTSNALNILCGATEDDAEVIGKFINDPSMGSGQKKTLEMSGGILMKGVGATTNNAAIRTENSITFNNGTANGTALIHRIGNTGGENLVHISGRNNDGTGLEGRYSVVKIGRNADNKMQGDFMWETTQYGATPTKYTIWNESVARSFGAVTALSSTYGASPGDADNYQFNAVTQWNRPIASNANGTGFEIQGCTAAAPTNTSAKLVEVYHDVNNVGTGDSLNYYGKTSANDNVQTKSSVTSLGDARYSQLGATNIFTEENTFTEDMNFGANCERFDFTFPGQIVFSNNQGTSNSWYFLGNKSNGSYGPAFLISPDQNRIMADVTIEHACNFTTQVPTCSTAPTSNNHLANKEYVDSHSNTISGGFQMGNWTATFDSSTTAPNSKVTKQGTYVKVGKMVHLNLHFTGQNFTGYEGTIRIKGVPFQPNTSMGKQIGTIHAVGFMVNNYHADDGHIALLAHDSTYGSHIKVISEQVNNETHYITNASGAEVSISITYISE